MEQIVVKTEVQPNGEILLYYVDDNEAASVNIQNQLLQMHEGSEFEIQELETLENKDWQTVEEVASNVKDKWAEDDVKRLLVFFIDNKNLFANGTAKKKHLLSIACKTMLIGKNAQACEVKLQNLKRKYSNLLLEHQRGAQVTWPLFDLCHQAFQNDTYIQYMLREKNNQEQKLVKVPIQKPEDPNTGVIVVKNVNTNSKPISGNAKVEMMLNLYLRYKKNFQKDYWRQGLWETIAIELGEEDADYWHRRFLNFKQHYLRLIAKRESEGPGTVSWPYMNLFDQIFANDPEFQKKYLSNITTAVAIEPTEVYNDWNDTEVIILAKYYFDCLDEFQDPTIPDYFLWNEVSRLLDKTPEVCKKKFEETRQAHLDKYFKGIYGLHGRNPLAILFDNIISKETEMELGTEREKIKKEDTWDTDDLDELVKFLYENIEMFKDPVGFYVCWAAVAGKLGRPVHACKKQWEDLKMLYKSTLDDKKENPDMQIDWRYIELFDRIFDYGMDTNLMNDFKEQRTIQKIGVKKVQIKPETDPSDVISDEEEFDERDYTKRSKRGVGDSKAFKILEYYQKHKDKFSTTQRKKQALWETLATQIGITGEQCAHRFRNLKQVYTAYVQREINKPEMPILWPYYALCKKVFGYRAIKSKLKNNKVDSEDNEEWVAKEIKQIINYLAANYKQFSESPDADSSKWSGLAQAMGRSETAVNDKFLELRRSYRKLKTMKKNNPECKVSWKYYSLFDEVYNAEGNEMEVEELEPDELSYEEMETEEVEINESQDEEDYQCIIVIPEGQDISDISNAKIMIQNGEAFEMQEDQEEVESQPEVLENQLQPEELENQLQPEELENQLQPETQQPENQDDTQLVYQVVVEENQPKSVTKWVKRTKKRLLILYLNYVRARKGREINPTEMWAEISSKFTDKSPLACRKMFAKLKSNHIKVANDDDENKKKSPYYALLEKVMTVKPRFVKKNLKNSKDTKVYKDVLLPTPKVELALQYYLQLIEEFSSPKFEKKYLWMELANFVSEPVNKLFNKINYLKQYYNMETDEVNGEKTLFGELLKQIIMKEKNLVASVDTEPLVMEENEDVVWSDEETEQLLVWYLTNLEKFKNPKFVRKYLWIEASSILEKSPLACSKKMTEIRTQYKTMIKESPHELNTWQFYELCQKIYGTGKKSESANAVIETV